MVKVGVRVLPGPGGGCSADESSACWLALGHADCRPRWTRHMTGARQLSGPCFSSAGCSLSQGTSTWGRGEWWMTTPAFRGPCHCCGSHAELPSN
jgi:hypothetical protein